MEKVVTFFEHENILVRMERANKRLWILCLLLIFALIGTNAGWLYYEHSFEDKVTTIEAEQDGNGTNIINGGDVSYGAESQDNN